MFNHVYLGINLSLYVLFFIFYQKHRKYLSTGSLYLLFTIVTCILAWICFFIPNSYYSFNDLTLFPFFYLFVFLIITALPILKFDERNTTLIQPSTRWFNILCVFIIAMSLMQIYDIVQSFNEGLSSMLWDIRSGATLYSETRSNADMTGEGISNIYAIIGGSFSHLVILFAFCQLAKEKINYPIVIGLTICFLIDMMASISHGERGNTVLKAITVVFAYWLTKNWIAPQVRRKITVILATIIILLSIPIVMITIGRFSSNSALDRAASNSVVYYAGQSMLNFNNYCLDAGGIRYGDRTANLFKRIFDPSTPVNYIQRRAKYSNLKIDDYYFYTHVGDFTLDYGPIWAALILIGFNIFFIAKTRTKDNKIAFHQLIIIYLVLCINCQGLTYLFSFADIGGGLKLVTTFLTYIYFKFDYLRSNKLIKI